ncbi:hypothetical protein GCM10010420_20710 [Streptomyces glaucosporus]|uniref:Uncharacterized protein n=1 Tax=Streptomyces glaucosporus TaxID=284044 RepID=A0ABP5V690_9ACTN
MRPTAGMSPDMPARLWSGRPDRMGPWAHFRTQLPRRPRAAPAGSPPPVPYRSSFSIWAATTDCGISGAAKSVRFIE